MDTEEFLHDCAQCAGLCCMAPAIHRSSRFPFEKPACTACEHLRPGGGCGVHAQRQEMGYLGCIDFTCLGAGQRVTQQMFGGASWQEDDRLREPMARAFLDLYRVQESRWLLQTAAFMGISPEREKERLEMLEIYAPPGAEGWTTERLDRMLAKLSPDTVRGWLRTLGTEMLNPEAGFPAGGTADPHAGPAG